MKRYLCDHNDSQHISFVKGQVVFWCAFEVVPGHTLCALRPWSLCGDVGRSLISKQITFLFLYLCSDTQPCLSFSGLSYLDLCHGEAVQSSHRSGFLASTIRAGKHTHTHTCSTYEEKQKSMIKCLQRGSSHHKHMLRMEDCESCCAVVHLSKLWHTSHHQITLGWHKISQSW